MQTTDTPIEGLKQLQCEPKRDERGSFSRLFCRGSIDATFVQMSLSSNPRKGTLRGLHFQLPPDEEEKWVHCLSGRVYDVVVDLRVDAPTFKQHFACELLPGQGFFIPKGCAHGFLTLEDDSSLLYGCTANYAPQSATGILWSDQELAIAWPSKPLYISEADRNRPTLESYALPLL